MKAEKKQFYKSWLKANKLTDSPQLKAAFIAGWEASKSYATFSGHNCLIAFGSAR